VLCCPQVSVAEFLGALARVAVVTQDAFTCGPSDVGA
jgi:hypothetical protein